MNAPHHARAARAPTTDARQFLATWTLSAASCGRLSIRPQRSTIRLIELAGLTRRLRPVLACGGMQEIVFDLAGARFVGIEQSVARQLLTEFARTLHLRCRIIERR